MRIIICDDDILIVEQINTLIHAFLKKHSIKCPNITCYTNGHDFLKDTGEKDIIFLDIEMPNVNGIYIGNTIKKQNPNSIIFIVTSYSEYLDDAMKFHVFRYLSKPIDKQRFFRNFKEAINLYYTTNKKIAIETKTGVYTIFATSILCIEASGRKVIIHTENEKYESINNMNYWMDTLPSNCFFQTHRSFIVNMNHIKDFDHELIYFTNNITAYLTKRKYTAFKEAYLLFLESTR